MSNYSGLQHSAATRSGPASGQEVSMETPHTPADLNQFRHDLDHCHVIRVFHDWNGALTETDCLHTGHDDFSLVFQPSIVITKGRAGGHAVNRAIPLSKAVMFELDPGASPTLARWVRNPNGVWLRLPPERK